MLFKPKFCCSCGEKIERLNWKAWTSRRFCQLCETEYGFYDWIPKIVFGFGLFFGLLGVSFYWQKTEKPLNTLSHQISSNSLKANNSLTNQTFSLPPSTNQNGQESARLNDRNSAPNVQKNVQAALLKQSLPQAQQIRQIENGKDTARETAYFCGAQTKKGTPCSRRRKSNSRCFQHVGQSAMLPPEKLKIN
jgi:hypothetical protein